MLHCSHGVCTDVARAVEILLDMHVSPVKLMNICWVLRRVNSYLGNAMELGINPNTKAAYDTYKRKYIKWHISTYPEGTLPTITHEKATRYLLALAHLQKRKKFGRMVSHLM